MDSSTIQTIERCARGSLQGELSFPEVLAQLSAVGVELYHVDLLRREATYYLRGGASHVEPLATPNVEIARDFTAPEVAAAVRASQAGAQTYPEFLRRAQVAGCIGYTVYLSGGRVVYCGRSGDEHMERFPAPPAVS